MTVVFRPIVLEQDGVFGQLVNGGLINAGGVSNPSGTFTVNGKGLLFSDGSSTDGGASELTLQRIYDLTPAVSGAARIKLEFGKDLVIADDDDDEIYFKVDAETGKVTITGDLEVLGSSTIIESIVQNTDHWIISPKSPATTALRIEPDVGVTPFVDLVTVRRTFASTPVFRIDKDGNLHLTQNIITSGLVDGVDVSDFRSDFDAHVAGTAFKHQAASINITPILTLAGATNVQAALEVLTSRVNSISGGGGTGAAVNGYEHLQLSPSTEWVINHPLQSARVQCTIYDEDWEQIIADSVKIIDLETIIIKFNTPIVGRVMILAF